MSRIVTEGFMPFLGYQTYYRIVGTWTAHTTPKHAPIILLHGGPGSTHNYMELLDSLADDGRAVISYDQLGCGQSFVDGHPELWQAQTWVDELRALVEYLGITEFHLLGQSWGGMLALTYLADYQPQGVRSVVLSSTLPSSQLWGKENHRMARMLPAQEWEALNQAEKTGEYESIAYKQAIDHYMQLHCCDSVYGQNAPECLRRPKKSGIECYETAWGPNELMPQGTLKDWDYTAQLPNIKTPALIVSGTDDLCTPLIAKTMFDGLPNARWELFEGCRHMCYADDTSKYVQLIRAWLKEHDKF